MSEWLWAPCVYALIAALLYYPIWFGAVGFGWDTTESYWADLAFFSDALGDGVWPHWNPYDRGGYPFSSDPQPAIYAPLQWVFAGIGVLTGGVSWLLIQVRMLANHVLAGALLYLFLRHLGLRRTAAFIGGLVWMASAPMMIHKASNLIGPLVYAPLIWLAVDRLVAKQTFGRVALLAFALMLAGSAGSPPGFFYTLLLSGGYAAYRLIFEVASQRAKSSLRLMGCFALAGLWLVAWSLIWVLPTFELMEFSSRAKRGLGYALGGGIPIKDALLGLALPRSGNLSVYLGLVPLIAAAYGLVAASSPKQVRRDARFFIVFAAFFCILALGAHTPVLAWLVTHVPGFDLFRVANRYKLLFALCLSASAACGIHVLIERGMAKSQGHITRAHSALIATALALAAINTLNVDGVVHTSSRVLERKPRGPSAEVRALLARDDFDKWRIFDEYAIGFRAGSRMGIRDFRGYPSGDPLEFRRYREVLEYAERYPDILEAFGVRWLLHQSHPRNGKRKHVIEVPPARKSPTHVKHEGDVIYEFQHPAPALAWYGSARYLAPKVGDSVIILDAIRRAHGAAVIFDGGIRAQEVARNLEQNPVSTAGAITLRERNRIVGTIQAPQAGTVVMNEIIYPGWRVFVDGVEKTPLRANLLLRGVSVEAGDHIIEWTYRPKNFTWLLALWWLATALAIVAASVAFYKKSEPASFEPSEFD